ncbi:MAG: hypothetical protein Q8P18_14430 [Pseudomonadota bacterium]|nr:hypothetical protein [Pseudomonadota bacterium]
MRLLLPLLLLGCGRFLNGTVSVSSVDDDADVECGGPYEGTLGSGFASTLEPMGCQYRITAVGDSLRLLLDVPAFADALTEGSGAATYTLPDDTVRMSVEVGCNLDAGWCGAEGEASIVQTYTPTAGTITVSTTREAASDDALATVTFEGVSLEDADGESLAMDTLTWTDVRLYEIAR